MPETVMVTYLSKTRFPSSLTLHVPGTEHRNEAGDVIPGTGATVTFYKGKSMAVSPVIADMVLNGPAGMLKLTVQDGAPVLSRAFVEGTVDDAVKNNPAALNEKIEMLQGQLADIISKLAQTGGISAEALESLGVAVPGEDEVVEPEGKPVSRVDQFTVSDGGFEMDEKGRLLCPECREWATQPVSPDFTEARARKSLNAHIRKAHKELFETDASNSEPSE